jgi:hypothetical protein
MAKLIGKKSRYLTRNMQFNVVAGFIWLALFAYVSFVMLTTMDWHSLISEIVWLLVFGPILFFINKQNDKHYSIFNAFKSGMRGEDTVWKELHKLSDQYTVFEDLHLPGRKENIDFMVVGPTGVYFIEVKNHFGNVSYNGQQLTRDGKLFERDFLKTALNQTMNLHNYLISTCNIDVFINPIIVFSHPFARVHFGHDLKNCVRVVHRRWLINAITTGVGSNFLVSAKLLECLETLTEKI